MTLLIHSGTAVVDLDNFRGSVESEIAQRVTALEKRLQLSIPEIYKLEHTTRDWIFQNGLHRPPPPPIAFHNFGPVSTASWVGPYAPHAHSFAQYPAYAPPVVLPREKREMPVIGYRSWKFQQVYKLGWGRKGALMPLHQSYGAWKAGKNQAICKTHVGHRAADVNCQCGFYVLASLDAAEQWAGGMADDVIVGAVVGWGQVVQHGSEGWRAEYARIIALLDCKFSEAQSRNTLTIAQTYKLEIKERGQLEAMVSEFGDPFEAAVTPSEVRP